MEKKLNNKYLVERNVPPMSTDELHAAAQKALEVSDTLEDVNWVRSFVSEGGKIYCELEATDENAVREHARRAGLPVDGIITAEGDVEDLVGSVTDRISPDMFR